MADLLSEDQIREIAANPPHKEQIQRAREYQDKLLRHSNPYLNRAEGVRYNSSIRKHFEYVASDLDPRQYAKYENYYQFPQCTLPITDTIYDDQFRVFKTPDRIDDIEISNPKNKEEYSIYYKGLKGWLSSVGWEIYRQRTCNLVFLDMTEEGVPVYEEVSIWDCVDYQPDGAGNLNYALFEKKGFGYIWVDADKYILFDYKDKDTESGYKPDQVTGVELGPIINEDFHELDFVPIRQFWTTKFDDQFTKETAISGKLASLDSYDYFYNGKDHNDLTNAFPQGWQVRQECSYENENTGHSCSNGFLVDKNGGLTGNVNDPTVCPGCNGGNAVKFVGGTLLVDPPTEDVSQITQPAGWVTIDPKVLEHLNAELDRREASIITSSIGDDISDNNQAKNEKQVLLGTESREAKLLKVVKNIDIITTWIVEGTAKMLYGDKFVGANIDSGRKFHLETLGELKENYTNSVQSGLPQTVALNDLDRIIDSEYRSNEKGKSEAKQWLRLEPFVGKSFDQVASLKEKGLITSLEWDYYKYFSELKGRFESEFMSIALFDSANESEALKLKKIKDKLLEWLKEMTEAMKGDEPKLQTNDNLNIDNDE
tara:strand:+ start:2435 stop:4228 length:1794 start_codon:yes stop_codon:yes gene_type:complete